MNTLKHLLLTFSLVFVTFGYSQTNETYFNDLIIQGEPFNKKVNVLFEDSVGYLWIGSNTGLYRYDGYNLVAYQQDVFNPHSIPNNNINSIIEDSDKNLWIGSESYLIYFNRKENKFKSFNKNITTEVLYKNSKGEVFANLKDVDLVKIDPKENSKNSRELSKIKEQVNSLIEDEFSRFWIGTQKGLFFLNKDNTLVATDIKNKVVSIKNFGNNSFAVLTDNQLYILGYNKTDFSLEILEHYPNIIDEVNIQSTSLAINKNNTDLWIGTENGLYKGVRYNNSYTFLKFTKESENGNLKNNFITSIVFDSFENLWIGSLKGINKYRVRSSIFEYNKIETPSKKDNDLANSLLFYTPNTILVGMESGLYKYDSKNNKSVKIHSNISNVNHITKTFEKNSLFVASNNTLYKSEIYTPKNEKLKLSEIKSYKNEITSIAVINKNETWVGLWNNGVDIINTESEISKFKEKVKTKLSKNHTSVFLLTKDHNLWIGTRGEGLFKIDLNNETIQEFLPSKENGLTSDAILSLHEDNNNNIWIGTRSGGLNKYIKETNSFKNFRKLNGMSSNTISAIKEDHNNNIWLSTQDGLVRFDVKNEKFIPFKIEDGIKESQFLFNSSASNTTNNTLFFGCTDGFYAVYSSNFIQKSKLPPTVITSFSTLGAAEGED